jgi:ankyrin repeat protein
MTALLFGALRGRAETVAALLDAGASLTARNRHGMTALLLAAEYNPDPHVTALLLRRGASMADRDEHGRTALMAAAARNNADVVEVLLAAGADPKAEDHEQRTAAQYAQYGNPKLAGTATFWTLYRRQY